MQMQGTVLRVGLFGGLALLAISGTWLLPPIAQDPVYHRFADDRELFGIPNFWNVVSSLPLSVVGVAGLWGALRHRLPGELAALRPAHVLFFIGVALAGLGSAHYHLAPSNATLLWDRLAMSVAFMALFATIVGEYVWLRAGRWLLWPLVLLGLGAVAYWYRGEMHGVGDLRGYALVQFLPLLLIPLILLLYRSPAMPGTWIWAMLALYALAKVPEMADAAIYGALGFGGHALKHILAAAAALCFLIALRRRISVERQRPD